MTTSSPFDPIDQKSVPESCRTAEIFKSLYSSDILPLFDPTQTKAQFYEKYTKIVPIDRCFCYFQDLGITLIKRDIAHGSVGSISIVEYEDRQYVVKTTKLHTKNEPTIAKELNYKFTKLGSLNFVGLNTFTLDTICTYIINNHFRNKLNVSATIHQYGASLCPKFGIQLLEKASGGDLRDFPISHGKKLKKFGYIQEIGSKSFMRRDMLANILLQIMTSILYAQDNLNYLHNDLKADNILISYEIDESTGKIKFQTKLADFGKASVKLGNTVLYFHQQKHEMLKDYEKYFDSSQTYEVSKYFVLKRNSEMMLFYKSFDIYLFFISLLTVEPFYNTFFYQFDEKSVFYQCWTTLFPSPETASLLFKRVSKLSQNFTKETARASTKQLVGIILYNDILPKIVKILEKSVTQSKT